MSEEEKDSQNLYFELCAFDNSIVPPARVTENPVWETVSSGIENSFKNGGFVYFRVLGGHRKYIKEICMKSLPGKYRLIAMTRSIDPKNQLLEWWESSDSSFRGTVRFGDDEWDARTVSSDLSIAEAVFREFFLHGDLPESISQFRSQWDPKP